MKKVGTVLLSVILAVLFFSCSKNAIRMKDGYYASEMAEYDKYGWKEFMAIRVSDGRIIHVEYDARNPSGFIKSWDMEYMRDMNRECGIYPNAYTRFYGNELLNKQNIRNIDCISGATHSYYTFLGLANATLENAYRGKSGIRMVYTDEMADNAGHNETGEDIKKSERGF